MTSRRTLRLKDVQAIRGLQRRAKEAEALRANAAVAVLVQNQAAARDGLVQNLTRWESAVSAGTLDLSGALGWSAMVHQGEQGLRALGLSLEKAEAQAGRVREEWRLASARADAADEVTRRAVRSELRRKEENVLAEISDTVARRC